MDREPDAASSRFSNIPTSNILGNLISKKRQSAQSTVSASSIHTENDTFRSPSGDHAGRLSASDYHTLNANKKFDTLNMPPPFTADCLAQSSDGNPPNATKSTQNIASRVESAFKDMFSRKHDAETGTIKIETKHWAEDDY